MGTFTRQQWQQIASDKLSGDESITAEEWKEVLDYLWEYLPPLFTKSVNEILEKRKEDDNVKIGDLVIINGLKNRWNINCCGKVESLNKDFADVYVFNLQGPGASLLVKNIPLSDLSVTPKVNYD